ncbi:hypothetical protein OH76DRAFT_1424395, partial [Lentinus brumalis]
MVESPPRERKASRAQKVLPLPRRQTIAKALQKGKMGSKVTPPDSSDKFFNPAEEEVDQEELERQTRLFTHNSDSAALDTNDDVEDLGSTIRGIKIKPEDGERTPARSKSKSVRYDMDVSTSAVPEPSQSPEELRQINDNYLDNLLEMNVHAKGKDTSGVLDYDNLDPVLLPTYSSLPRLRRCRADFGAYTIM